MEKRKEKDVTVEEEEKKVKRRRSRRRILTVTMLSREPVSTEYIGLPSISPLHNCRVQATLGYSWASVQWCPIPVVLSWYISYTLALQMLRWSRSLRVQC